MAEPRNNNSGHTKPTTRDINAAQRASLALKLRSSKLSYEQIARQCGYADRGAAHKAVQREMSRVVVENVEELRREELATLDQLQTECMTLALDRKNTWRLQAVDRVLALMERRARLMGLDIPVDSAAMANVVVVREVPQNYLGMEAPK